MGFLKNENGFVDKHGIIEREIMTAFMVRQLVNGNIILLGECEMAAIN